MIEVLEDEDDHALEWHYTIDHVYRSKIIMKSKLTFARGENVDVLGTKEDIVKFFDYLIRKSRSKFSVLRSTMIDFPTSNHVDRL